MAAERGSPATVGDFLDILETIAPVALAEKWDNPGLQVGSRLWPVASAQVALDPLPNVVCAAAESGVDLLVTHHPLIFSPLRSIDVDRPAGSIVQAALKARLAIVSAHTNLDSAFGGLNDALAERLGLKDLRPLTDAHNLGRVGDLESRVSLEAFALEVRRRLELERVRVVGRPDLSVSRVAVCTGSGGSLLPDFMACGAQVYVSGDLRYHDAREAEVQDRGLIDVGHFGGERLAIELLCRRIGQELRHRGLDAAVEPCRLEKEPFAEY